jgi:hypothetical protein
MVLLNVNMNVVVQFFPFERTRVLVLTLLDLFGGSLTKGLMSIVLPIFRPFGFDLGIIFSNSRISKASLK